MKELSLKVSGMSCAHCESRVNKAVLSVSGVSKCVATAQHGRVDIAYDEAVTDLAAVKAAIEEAGYDVE